LNIQYTLASVRLFGDYAVTDNYNIYTVKASVLMK